MHILRKLSNQNGNYSYSGSDYTSWNKVSAKDKIDWQVPVRGNTRHDRNEMICINHCIFLFCQSVNWAYK